METLLKLAKEIPAGLRYPDMDRVDIADGPQAINRKLNSFRKSNSMFDLETFLGTHDRRSFPLCIQQ